MSSSKKSYENVIYKGETGTLTLTQKFFHYQANIADASVKCNWARVEKRQLSPPGAEKPLLKLILSSGRTTVFEVDSTSTLLDLVKEAKARMEQAEQEPKPPQALEQAPEPQLDSVDSPTSKRKSAKEKREEEGENANNKPKTKRSSVKPQPRRKDNKDDNDDGDEEAPKKRRSSTSSATPPRLPGTADPFLTQAKDRRDDSRATICYCCWDSIYCWICLAATVVLVLGIAVLIYFFAIKDKGGSHDRKNSLEQCADPMSPSCPPDDGLEDRYGIRAVEYVWTTNEVRLEYYISDYILDSSVDFVVYDGVECRDSQDEEVPKDNEWLKVQLMDGAPQDGGANLYNEGKGTRQFDIVLSPRTESRLQDAPFYAINSAAVDRAFLRVCVGFHVHYNQIDGFNQTIEVNYIENAIQMRIGNEDQNMGAIQDIQVKTVTRPEYQ